MAPHHRMPSTKPIKPIFIIGGIVVVACLLSSSMTAGGFISGVRTVFSGIATPQPAARVITVAPVATFAPTAKPAATHAPEKTSSKPFPHGSVVGV